MTRRVRRGRRRHLGPGRDRSDGALRRRAPRGARRARHRAPEGFQAVGGAGLWRSDPEARVVRRLDPRTGSRARHRRHRRRAAGVVVDDDGVWVADVEGDRVLHIDPDAGVGRPVGRRRTVPPRDGPRRRPAVGHELRERHAHHDRHRAAARCSPRCRSACAQAGSSSTTGRSGSPSTRRAWCGPSTPTGSKRRRSSRPPRPSTRSTSAAGASFIRCMGSGEAGSPTVLLEAMAGQWSEHQLFVQYGLQSTHRVCAYDRAGLGRSDPDVEPRTPQRIVDDLDAALDAAGIPGPYVLVGHQQGGLYARLFAAQHADEVARPGARRLGHADVRRRASPPPRHRRRRRRSTPAWPTPSSPGSRRAEGRSPLPARSATCRWWSSPATACSASGRPSSCGSASSARCSTCRGQQPVQAPA